MSLLKPKTRGGYFYENADQFLKVHNIENLSLDRKTVYNDIKNLIEKMRKNGVSRFSKFYQFLNKEVTFNHGDVRALAVELLEKVGQIYLCEKTRKNMNASDLNSTISYAAFISPNDTFHIILYKIIYAKRTDTKIYEENLKELIGSVLKQKETYIPAQPVEIKSMKDGEGGQIDLNQRNERISRTETDQFVITQSESVRSENVHKGETRLKDFSLLKECTFEFRQSINEQNETDQSVNVDKRENQISMNCFAYSNTFEEQTPDVLYPSSCQNESDSCDDNIILDFLYLQHIGFF